MVCPIKICSFISCICPPQKTEINKVRNVKALYIRCYWLCTLNYFLKKDHGDSLKEKLKSNVCWMIFSLWRKKKIIKCSRSNTNSQTSCIRRMISSFDIDRFCVSIFICLINWDVNMLTIFFHACIYICLFQRSSPVLNSDCDTVLVIF